MEQYSGAGPLLSSEVGGAGEPRAEVSAVEDSQARVNLPRRPSKTVTLLLALFGAGALGLLYLGVALLSPLELLDRPLTSGIRTLEGALDQLDATAADPWMRALLELQGAGREELLDQTIDAYREMLESSEDLEEDPSELPARRAILLFERGRADEARAEIESSSQVPERAVWTRAVAWAYGVDEINLDASAAREQLERLAPGWAKRVALRRWAERTGEEAVAAIDSAAERVHLDHQRRMLVVGFSVWLAPVAVGLAIGTWWLFAHRRVLDIRGSATLPPRWSAIDGLGVAVRGVWIHILLVIVGLAAASWIAPVSTAVAFVALIWMTWLYLERASARRLIDTLGLGLMQGSPLAWIGLVLVVLAIDQGGTLLLVVLARPLGAEFHWSESLFEELLYESWPSALAIAGDIGLIAPLFEETLFRGLLFAALLPRLSPVAAALVSSGIFSILHGYSPLGCVAVGWSGFVWALAYEKSHSLWPGVICHAFNNSILAGFMLALNR
jgi:membrane protease YdiL (CAAX protease family)